MDFKKILDELYLDILHRHIDKEGLSYYSPLLQNNSITINEIKDNLLNSDERKNNPIQFDGFSKAEFFYL